MIFATTRVPVGRRIIPNQPIFHRPTFYSTFRPFCPPLTHGFTNHHTYYDRTSSAASLGITLLAVGFLAIVGLALAGAPRHGYGYLDCVTYQECGFFGCRLVEECTPF